MPPLSRYRWPHLPLLWVDGLSASLPPWVGGLWAAPEVQAAPVPPLSRYRWPHFLSCGWMAPVPPFGRSGPTLPPPNSWPSGFLWGDCPQPSCGQTHLSQPSPRSPVRPLFPPLPPPFCLLPRHHAPFSSLVDGWLNASFPATQAHLTPFPPASPCPPPRADPRHPPWVARPMTARPFPIRRPALTVRLPYSTQATFGGGLFPPPLHPYTPGFGIGHRPPWPGVVCCPHPPGAALLPGRKVLGPTLQPMDKEHASPPIYLPPSPPEGFSGYTVVTDRDCAGK